MAQNSARVDSLKKDLECPLCLDYYEDPVSLSCQHNFCRKCLDSYSEQGTLQELKCPVCRQVDEREHARVQDIPKNFQLESIIDNFLAVGLEGPPVTAGAAAGASDRTGTATAAVSQRRPAGGTAPGAQSQSSAKTSVAEQAIQIQECYFKMPYTRDINGMGPGKRITVQGRPTDRCTRFHINLMRNRNFRSGDIALHFNPRFWWIDWRYIAVPWKVVVRNTRVNGEYGPEERKAPKFPFACGVPFKIEFKCRRDQFDIFVDGEFFISYAHRIPDLASIKIFHVTGDVHISSVEGCS